MILRISPAFSMLAFGASVEVGLRSLEFENLPTDIELNHIDDDKLYKHYENVFESFSKSVNVEMPSGSPEDAAPKVDDETFSLLARDMLERPMSLKPESFLQRKDHKLNNEDMLFQALATNEQTLWSKEMQENMEAKKAEMDIDTAAGQFGESDLPVDVVQLLRAEVDGTEATMPAKVVDEAIQETRGLMAGITAKVDRLIIYWCMPRDIYLRELFQSQIFEMVRLAGEFRSEIGTRQVSLDKIYQIKGARDAVLTDLSEKRRQFWAESSRVKQQIKKATETMLVKKVLFQATDPNYKANKFLQNGKNTLYKLCPPNMNEHEVHDIDQEDDEDDRSEEDEDAPVSGMEFVLLDPKIRAKMDELPLEARSHLKQALGAMPETNLLEIDEGNLNKPTKPSSGKTNKKAASNRCLADRGGSQMKMLHDRCSKMLGKEQDKLDKLNEELAESEEQYNKDKRRFTSTLNGQKRQEGEKRAVVNDAETLLLAIWKDYREVANMAWRLWWWLWWTRYWCRWQLRQYVHVELCSLLKIRDNIVTRFKKADPLKDVVDCQVTPWRGGKCSKTCDRGTRQIYRIVEAAPNQYGAYCPRLKARMTCNNFPCPVDCTVTPWAKFDACSVKCGEGTKSRSRTVATSNKHRGKQCPQLIDSQACFMKPCDVDCTLADWSKFSGCSRSCEGRTGWGGSGRSFSVRPISVKRKGNGRKCASKYSPVRITSKKCNNFPCSFGKLKCEAKQDIVIAVDSSGSLRPWGAKALHGFLEEMADRYVTAKWASFTDRKRVQVTECKMVMYKQQCDKVWKWQEFKKWKWRRYNKVGLISFSTEAKVLTPLTYYRDKIAAAAKKYVWDGLGTQTHLAVRKSVTLFKTGRAKAQSVLMIFTDSIPDRNFMMAKDIEAAKATGVRVIIVYFGWRRSWTLKKYVTFPPRDNFVRLWSTWAVNSWWGKRWYGNRLIRITCPRITPLPMLLKHAR